MADINDIIYWENEAEPIPVHLASHTSWEGIERRIYNQGVAQPPPTRTQEEARAEERRRLFMEFINGTITPTSATNMFNRIYGMDPAQSGKDKEWSNLQ